VGTYGGFAPQPERYGGGKRRAEHILDALSHSTTTEIGVDSSEGTEAWIEDFATARAIEAAWGTNERGANEFDPRRTQSMLARWETILGALPLPEDRPPAQRERLEFKWQALTKRPTRQQMVDDLAEIAGGVFVEFTTTSSTTGPSYYPGSPFSNPYTATGATVFGDIVDWWSNVLHLAVQVVRPAGMTALDYADNLAAMNLYLDGALPAWVTWSTYQLAHAGAVGFYLDEADLDLEAFDV
jgi:hypothetical protein